jgi:hypothetical protein
MENNFLCRNKECTNGNFGKRKRYNQTRHNEIVCSPECGYQLTQQKTYIKKREVEIRKENLKNKKVLLEKLETHSDWCRKLQKVFNAFIRERDKNKRCISCQTPLQGRKFDAGHCFSVGAYPNLRFNEDNVHGQCVPCNQHKHGNIHEYMSNLPIVIGDEAFERLQMERNNPLKLNISEIKQFIEAYKQKFIALKINKL